ncbi:lck-interacting transmembrane adapter 1 isoform X2 [Peromyscus californicus insignis]|uniref:lck-interacting transmembrane adapter 1 isoform X2 n=1 Tax=Peromyscus californicus insignis TaxID=564181 RepID=UPI0022A66EC2|nr:lck-interacting transmembrane adapter 1 isoform X2 [Peromyscus californicus insignis]
MGQGKNARPGGFRCAESTREEEPTSWARSASRAAGVHWFPSQPPALIFSVLRSSSLLYKMRPPVPSAPLALWVLGCSLLLWLWALCTACHRKRAQRQQTGLQGSLIPVEMSLLRQTHLCSLSKSDTRLHELHQGPRCSIAPRPASMDLLHPHWLEVSRGSTRSQVTPSAFPPRQLPRAPPAALATAPSTSPEATYSNVGLAAIPRASLAASPVVWAGTQLTISCAKLGPGAEYACIQKRKETKQGYQELQQKAKVIPATQMDLLYSRVCKPKRRDPRPDTDQPDPQGGSDVEYEAITLRGQDMNQDPLENVYESIREMGP